MPGNGLTRPASNEYAPFYGTYVDGVPEGDLLGFLATQAAETAALLARVSEEKSHFRYEPGKWTIREVTGHLSDSERVFTYRALTFARADPTALPPFDENAWAASSNAESRPMSTLLEELQLVRAASLALFRGFSATEWERWGTASGKTITVRALAYIVGGHERHHVRVLRDRYGL